MSAKSKWLRMSSGFLAVFLLLSLLLSTAVIPAFAEAPNQAGQAQAQPVNRAGTSRDGNYAIYPIPQTVRYTGGEFAVGPEVVAVVGAGVDAHTAAYLRETLEGYAVTLTEAAAAPAGKTSVTLRVDPAVANADKPDAYTLTAKDGEIVITGKTTDSVFYGVATLKMMLSSFAGEKLLNVQIEDYASVAVRGYIEGFYGNWGVKEREDLMRFARDYKMNSYVYAAKGDTYHTHYDQMYPQKKLDEFAKLVKVGEETKVQFGWSIHLGSFFDGINEGNLEQRYQVLLQKIDQLVKVGVRRIDVLNDDFGNGDHALVVRVLNRLNEDLKKKGCVPLTYCPQGYNKAWSHPNDPKELIALRGLSEDIAIYWTGDDVNWPLTQDTINYLKEKSNHAPDFWMNYPVNEHAPAGIFLGDISYYARDGVNGLAGFHSNPSCYAYANQVALYQLAALNWNNTNYQANAQTVWESAFDYLQPEVQDSYRTIARNVSNAPDSGRVSGFNESEYLAQRLSAVLAELPAGGLTQDPAVWQLIDEFEHMQRAVEDFRAHCETSALVSELTPWLNSLADLAAAGREALMSVICMEQNDTSSTWMHLSTAIKRYDSRYSYKIPGKDKCAKAGSKRLDSFVFAVINHVKNALMPILDPYDDTVNPVLFARLGGQDRTVDANGKKMYDGNPSSFAEWTIVQEQGDYFGLDLGREVPIRDITILQGKDDSDWDIFHIAELQYSSDGKSWEAIPAVVEGNTVRVENAGVRARYVRYYLTTAGFNGKPDYWTRVREFTVNKKEPVRDRVYTNMESLKKTPLTLDGSSVGICGLEGVTLKAGDYLGVRLAEPQTATGFVKKLSNEEGLAFEYSYNGISWSDASAVNEPVGVKYLRIINHSGADKTLDVTEIGMSVRSLRANPTLISSSMPLERGDCSQLFDGSLSTGILTRNTQANGQEMIFDLGRTVEIHDVTTVTTDGAERFYDAKVQISADRRSWTDVVTIAKDNSVFDVPYRYAKGDAQGQNARYMRVLITGNHNQKLKLNEIQINEQYQTQNPAAPVISNLTGSLKAVADHDIVTLLTSKAQAGSFVEYRVQDPVRVRQVSVIQGSNPTGTLSVVQADGSEVVLGKLDDSVAVFHTEQTENIAAVRISWDGPADVTLHELCVAVEPIATDDIGEYVPPIMGGDPANQPESNVALHKAVTASGRSDGNKDFVTDGKPDTKWDSPYLKGDGAVKSAWLAVDLAGRYDVSQVKIQFHNKIYSTNYDIQISDNGTNWTTIKNVTHPNGDPDLFALIETIDLDSVQTTSHLRLVFHSVNAQANGNGVGIRELEVWGKPASSEPTGDKTELRAAITAAEQTMAAPEYANNTRASRDALNTALEQARAVNTNENAAAPAIRSAAEALNKALQGLRLRITAQSNIGLRAPVSVSGSSNGQPIFINDGNEKSKWDSNYIKVVQPHDSEAWFRIDLGEGFNLIDQLNVNYFNMVYPTQYEVQVSNDDQHWTTVKTLAREHNGPVHPKDVIPFANPVSGRYIRMRFTEMNNVAAGHGIGINEAAILGRRVYEKATITAVALPENITVPAGQSVSAALLPGTLLVKVAVDDLAEPLTVEAPVAWDLSAVDTAAGTYPVTAAVQLPGVPTAEGVALTVQVTLAADAAADSAAE